MKTLLEKIEKSEFDSRKLQVNFNSNVFLSKFFDFTFF